MKTSINLGQKWDGPCCAPEASKPEEPKEHYPSVYLSGEKAYELPESGEMTVRFKRVSRSETERDGKERHEVTLDLIEITSVKPDKETEDSDSPEAALDKLREAIEKTK
jgi:hypothetical protein